MKKGAIIGILGGVLCLGLFLFLAGNHEPSSRENNSLPRTEQPRDNEAQRQETPRETCPITFTEYLIEPSFVQKVGQVGVVHGFGKTIVERSYISVKPEFVEQEIPIYAPRDMILVGGAHYQVSSDPAYMPDYVLRFNAGCNVEVVLGHLKGVVPAIDALMGPMKNDSREDFFPTPLHFKAGDLIGSYYQQAQGGVAGFDFIVRDRNVINQFTNQERYSEGRADNLISGVCPYDYYTGEKKTAYYNLLGGGGGTVFRVKNCGKASRDVPGTIGGMWFLDQHVVGSIYEYYTDGLYGSPISIAGDEERIAIGHLGTQEPVIYIWSRDASYKLPETVTTEHCYQRSPSGYVFFKVLDARTMDVFYSESGTCPSSFPSSGSRRYYK